MCAYHIALALYPNPSAREFIPDFLFSKLPISKESSASNLSQPRRKAWAPSPPKDYRFGPIEIDWVDFSSTPATMAPSSPEKSKAVAAASRGGAATAKFRPSDSTSKIFGTARIPQGVVHLYRDASASSAEPDTVASETPLSPDEDGGVTLAVLAVPSWMTPADFLSFVAPAEEGMAHLRIIRDAAPNRSIALIKFRERDYAELFAESYNGKPFNSLEPETCHAVHIKSILIEGNGNDSVLRHFVSSGAAHELPTCPVCLERMDHAVTGLVTVPCSHTFHCMCLSKWGDSRCPVCRYSQTLLTSHPNSTLSASPSTPRLSTCSSCNATSNLWICVICGNVACGRYGRAHAHEHYTSTMHLYALELETQRVWDYAGDGYVHRLIQNRADGKLVELPSAATSMGTSERGGTGTGTGTGPSQADALAAEKVEAIGIEYSYLLTSQLDTQRAYYEEQTANLEGQLLDATGQLAKVSAELERSTREARESREEAAREMETVRREKAKLEVKTDKVTQLAKRLERELKEERAVSSGLLENMGVLRSAKEKAEAERQEFAQRLRDCEDQLRDVMFFLEAREKIENGQGAEAEASGGSIELPPPPSNSTPSRRKKGKK
ncbi:hypothetical protein BOTBODRAFT_28668 [Botryobasidium botryosum FD-172 SS1]|uniref:BRCA1-associated protein n=1 Tax=Botryobasidium botryosum (strain FD-172 SS1) TaxID=930990 RepID=A0A067MTW7_BOTB1|nr:hypothetical protein BOTBODRAFT_28668 [Botryobasidium botryosum FD-172 SS1]